MTKISDYVKTGITDPITVDDLLDFSNSTGGPVYDDSKKILVSELLAYIQANTGLVIPQDIVVTGTGTGAGASIMKAGEIGGDGLYFAASTMFTLDDYMGYQDKISGQVFFNAVSDMYFTVDNGQLTMQLEDNIVKLALGNAAQQVRIGNTINNPTGAKVQIHGETDDDTKNALDITQNNAPETLIFSVRNDGVVFINGQEVINFVTGALAAGQEKAVMLVNIDETLATGGEVSVLEVLTTTEGTEAVIAVKAGAGVNAIRQEKGTFGDADSILNKAVNVLVALSSGGAGNISAFVADNDTFTVGFATAFGEIEVILNTGASAAGIAPTFEYSTGVGTWAAFVPVDGTNAFRNTGSIEWDANDLAGFAVGTGGEFLIRITRTRNTLTTTPIIDLIQVAGLVEYCWDKDGNIIVDTVTANQAGTTIAPTLTPTGTTETINWNNGAYQILDLGTATGDVTLTFNNPIAGVWYTIDIIQGATPYDVILPSNVLIAGGTAPTTIDVTITDNAVDSMDMRYDGTNYKVGNIIENLG